MSEVKLRPYQEKFLESLRGEFEAGQKKICGVAPCGAGKTIMTGQLILDFVRQNKRVIFFVHRKELIEQTSKTFELLGIEHSVITPGLKANYDSPVQIVSVQTLSRRLHSFQKPDLLVCDECHHILANSYREIIDYWKEALLLGVTATPQRMGGINLGDVFTSMIETPSTKELIELGYLTRFNYFAPTEDINFSKVRVKFGEYVNNDLEREMSRSKIIGNIVEHYKKFANGKKAICYCINVRHSQKVAAAFKAAGIAAEHCDGETNKKVREKLVEDFRTGNIKILCNAELFGEGFDLPNMQAVILARPTKSLTLYTQQALRPLRPDPQDPNKVAIIIDHVKNYLRFGLPDEKRDWSLEPNPQKETGEAPLMSCPDCFTVVSISTQTCPHCGHQFVTEEDKEARLTENVGKLSRLSRFEVTEKISRTPSSSPKPNSPEEFLKIAKERDYKMGWVALNSLEYAQSYEDCLHIAEICGYKPGWAWYQWRELQNKNMPKENFRVADIKYKYKIRAFR